MQWIDEARSLGEFTPPKAWFSGPVKVTMLFKSTQWRAFGGARVEFAASTRTAWHSHPAGQTLIVTDGEILTGVQGENGKLIAAQIAKKGDAISCPVGIKHFHGATPNAAAAHIALTGELSDGSNSEWFEPVSEADYKAAYEIAKNGAK